MNTIKYQNLPENSYFENESTLKADISNYENIEQNEDMYGDITNNEVEVIYSGTTHEELLDEEEEGEGDFDEGREYNDNDNLIASSSNKTNKENFDIQDKPDITETSSISGSTFNFTNSIIGAGVIGMPLAFKESGLVVGIILLFLLTWLVDWTVGVLIKDSKLSGQKTYQGLMNFCFGKFGYIIISIFQFIFAFGGMCAYGIIVGDTISTVMSHILESSFIGYSLLTSRTLIICVTTLFVILPLSLNKDISKLAKTSFLSLLGMMFITFSVIFEGFTISDDLKGDQSQQFTIFNKDVFQHLYVIIIH